MAVRKVRHADDSIEFLKANGIDFERLKSHGVDISEFGRAFVRILHRHMNLVRVTFHGLYDLAYVMRLLDKGSLPNTMSLFAEVAGSIFGTVVDVKCMAKLYGPVMVPAPRYRLFNAVSFVPHGATCYSFGVLYVPVGFSV